MCKKLVLAAAAILVGSLIVKHTSIGSLARVWWNDAREAVTKQIPPEVQVRQLKGEVDKIDGDIKRNIGRLANLEVSCEKLEGDVNDLKGQVTNLKADMRAMDKALDSNTERVNFKGQDYRASFLAGKLSSTTSQCAAKQGELKAKEQLLGIKKQTLEVARARINEMFAQKEELRATIERLESRLETAKLNAARSNAGVEFDDSQVARCKELAKSIDERLSVEEKTIQHYAEFGFTNPLPKVEESKPTAEIRREARKVLGEDDAQRVAAGEK